MNSDDTTSSSQEKFKIVMLGDMGVGKSSIVERLIYDRFDERKNVHIGRYIATYDHHRPQEQKNIAQQKATPS